MATTRSLLTILVAGGTAVAVEHALVVGHHQVADVHQVVDVGHTLVDAGTQRHERC